MNLYRIASYLYKYATNLQLFVINLYKFKANLYKAIQGIYRFTPGWYKSAAYCSYLTLVWQPVPCQYHPAGKKNVQGFPSWWKS